MPKLKLYLLLITVFISSIGMAQSLEKYYHELSVQVSHSSRYNEFIVDDYLRQDSLIIRDVRSSIELEMFINKGAQNKIYAVELNAMETPDMLKAINLLSQCPNLQYLKISYLLDNLPAEISKLQQLSGIEFSWPAL